MSDEHQWREVWNGYVDHTRELGSELDDVYMTGASAVVALRELRARVIEIADRAATAASDTDIDVRIGEALADLAVLGEELRRR
jgi:hypothetical protein